MKEKIAGSVWLVAVIFSLFFSACQNKVQTTQNTAVDPLPTPDAAAAPSPSPEASPSPRIPNLQAELTDTRNKSTEAPIGKFDFKNFTYPLPRGWQGAGVEELSIENGIAPASQVDKQIGLSYVTAKYLDVTGDGQDEAVVVVKIVTAGSAIPQVAYVFEWKNNAPELIWYFRTGDRADGGLKDLRAENGEFIIELYGQDRFILGEAETGKITGDEEQLCCPNYFTRIAYKWNGKNFQIQRKRLTFSVEDPSALPVENMADKVNPPPAKSKK
jgi:hypothetical protein